MKNELNPNRVLVNTSSYVRSHGKLPRGTGLWAFCPVGEEPTYAPDDGKSNLYTVHGTYSEAKKRAQARFAGRVEIVVLP